MNYSTELMKSRPQQCAQTVLCPKRVRLHYVYGDSEKQISAISERLPIADRKWTVASID